MTQANATKVTIEATVNAPLAKVWQFWTEPNHVTKWNNASDDWHTPRAENDLRVGGKFNYRMEARDGKVGFDFEGAYTDVKPNKYIAYEMSDGRKVETTFSETDGRTNVTSTFDAESTNSIEMQRNGWQAILNNFKRYTEGMK